MSKKSVIFVWVTILLWACNSNVVEKPEHLLSREQMEDVLYDLTVFQAAENYKKEKLEEQNIAIHSYIYSKYGIDSTILVQNHKYYASDVKKYRKMHKRVLERLENEEKVLDSLITKNKIEKLPKEVLNDESIVE